MWSLINNLFNLLFDVLLWPVQGLPIMVQAAFLGLPAAVFALVVFRYTSDQEGIEAAKDKVKAHLLELRLYKDDLRVTLRAQKKILLHNAKYLRYSLAPMAVMIVPFVLMIVQVESRFAYRSLWPGETALLTVTVDGKVPPTRLGAVLSLPDGLRRETPALRIDETGEIVWRVRAESPGEHRAGIRVGDAMLEKRILVDGERPRVSPAVYRSNDFMVLAYPAEKPLDAGTRVRSIRLSYPEGRGVFAGLSTASWIFFAASLVFGFALRGAFGVTF